MKLLRGAIAHNSQYKSRGGESQALDAENVSPVPRLLTFGGILARILAARVIRQIKALFAFRLSMLTRPPSHTLYSQENERVGGNWLTSDMLRNILAILQPHQLVNMKGHGAVP